MPCNSDYMEPTYGEKKAASEMTESFKFLGNRATHASDVLREYLLGNVGADAILMHINLDLSGKYVSLRERDDKAYVKSDTKIRCKVNELVQRYEDLNHLTVNSSDTGLDPETLAKLEEEQIKHREEDLSRLMKTFADAGDRLRLRKVLDADSSKPLTPQLGFDPDTF